MGRQAGLTEGAKLETKPKRGPGAPDTVRQDISQQTLSKVRVVRESGRAEGQGIKELGDLSGADRGAT